MAMTRKRLVRVGFYGGTGLILLFMLLDPYSRQSIFGPKIQGEPLCYWQQEFRRRADPNPPKEPAMMKVLAFVGIKSPAYRALPLNGANTLRVALSLIDDPSPPVRVAVALTLGDYPKSPEAIDGLLRLFDDREAEVRTAAVTGCSVMGPAAAPAWPRLKQLLEDEDLPCRALAASVLANAGHAKNKKTLTILLGGLDATDRLVRFEAAASVCRFGKEFPECFADVTAAARKDLSVRLGFARHASEFGPIALPILIELLRDGNDNVSCGAAISLGAIGPQAKAAIPALIQAKNAPGFNTGNCANEALSKIDPERYPQKKGAGEQ